MVTGWKPKQCDQAWTPSTSHTTAHHPHAANGASKHTHNNNNKKAGITMSDIQWDEFGASEFVKFATVGDTVAGKITNIRIGQDFNGNPCPVLDLETKTGSRTVTAGQANLKSQIVQLRPSVGDSISITYDRDEKAEKGMKKVFAIKVDSNTAPF